MSCVKKTFVFCKVRQHVWHPREYLGLTLLFMFGDSWNIILYGPAAGVEATLKGIKGTRGKVTERKRVSKCKM